MARMAKAGGFLFLAATSAMAAGPQPEWRFDAYPYRMFFTVPREARSNVIVRLPRAAGMPVTPEAFACFSPTRAPVPIRVAYSDNDEVAVQAGTGEAKAGGGYCLYFGAAGPKSAVPAAPPDPAPIAGTLRPAQGVAIPSTVERIRHMTRSISAETPRVGIASFDQVADAKEVDRPGRRGHGRGANRQSVSMATFRTHLACRAEGVYRFALSCEDAAYVMLDGEEVVSWMGEHDMGDWRQGKPVAVKAGVHRLDVLMVFSGTAPLLRIGWIRPRQTEVEPVPVRDCLGAYEAVESRIERANRILQPGFTMSMARAYRFRDTQPVFIPVTFRNTTEDWITGEFSARWDFGDGARGAGSTVEHVYTSLDEFKATIEVRDSLGFAGSCSHAVDCGSLNPEEYAVAVDLMGIPPVCCAKDRIEPCLLIRTLQAPSLSFNLGCDMVLRSGKTLCWSGKVGIGGEPVRVGTIGAAAGEISEIRWTARHEGAEVFGGVVRFLKPPMQARPTGVAGEALIGADGGRMVLVPDEAVQARPLSPPHGRNAKGWVVCVDDMLAAGGLLDKDAGEPYHAILNRLLSDAAKGVRYQPLPPWESFPESSGRLRKFVDVPAALGTNAAVAVLSVGLRDMLNAEGAAVFERNAAALTDLLLASPGTRVVWVTPPPYPSDLERSREFAAAVRRVCEPRGVSVADLFTRFRCEERNWRTFFAANPLMLSERGHRLAAQEIARAVVGE